MQHNTISLKALKIIGKEFQKNCYKTIFRKINTEEIFSNLNSLQIKTIFQEKISICENLLSRYV